MVFLSDNTFQIHITREIPTAWIKFIKYINRKKPSTEIETPVVNGGGGSEPEDKNTDNKFKSWESGIYKINGDKSWTYHLTDDKQWEAKKDNGSFVNLKDKLSPENYTLALKTLESAKKQ